MPAREIRAPLPEITRLHRVGVVRSGIRKTTMKDSGPVEYPSATEHFVVNTLSTSQQSADSFHQRYGEEPKSLDIVLPGETVEDVLFTRWQMYGGSAAASQLNRKCEGPGGTSQVRAGADWVEGPCQCQAEGLKPGDKKHCTQRWTLSFLLMDVSGLGVWQFGTNSVIAGRNFTAVLATLEGMVGTLLRAEMNLRLVPETVSPEGRPKTVYVGALEPQNLTPRQAIALKAELEAAPKLGELPAPIADDDPMLDGGVVGAHDLEPIAPLRNVEPLPSVKDQIRELATGDRAELYRLAGVERGWSSADVEAKLWATWGELELLDVEQLDVGYLYAELLAKRGDA